VSERHINRFVAALAGVHGIQKKDGRRVRLVVEALASMTEQSAYSWFAQEEMNAAPVSVETAAEVVTQIWNRAIFEPGRASPSAEAS
jgi:hypothetical protein